jgi:uncharacterized membrane protein
MYVYFQDQEGFAQIFVWVTFLSILMGYLIVLMIGVECVMKSKCLLSDMDWLSGSAFLVLVVIFLTSKCLLDICCGYSGGARWPYG